MRILLLGASGLLGGVLYQHLARRHDVTGTSTRTITGLKQVDITDPAQVREAASGPFDLIVHCAGLVDLHRAEQEPSLATHLHVTATEQLTAAARARIVYFSSDNVFPGTAPRYTECARPAPLSVYGRTKLAAERIVLRQKDNLVIRVPLLFGYSPWSAKFIHRLRQPQIHAVTDVVTNPVYLPDVAEHLQQLWEMSGVVHFGGPDVATRFGFMDAACRELGLSAKVMPISNRDIDPDALRPPRLVLQSARHTLAGRPITEALKDMAAYG